MRYHCHAIGICIGTEAYDDEAGFFGKDGLVEVPGGGEVGEKDGAHCCDIPVELFCGSRDV
jgi:hypothetical protein